MFTHGSFSQYPPAVPGQPYTSFPAFGYAHSHLPHGGQSSASFPRYRSHLPGSYDLSEAPDQSSRSIGHPCTIKMPCHRNVRCIETQHCRSCPAPVDPSTQYAAGICGNLPEPGRRFPKFHHHLFQTIQIGHSSAPTDQAGSR